MQKSPGVLLHMLRDYTAIKEGLEPNGNCLRDGYTVAVIYQKIFQDGTCMTVIYHEMIIMGPESKSQVSHVI